MSHVRLMAHLDMSQQAGPSFQDFSFKRDFPKPKPLLDIWPSHMSVSGQSVDDHTRITLPDMNILEDQIRVPSKCSWNKFVVVLSDHCVCSWRIVHLHQSTANATIAAKPMPLLFYHLFRLLSPPVRLKVPLNSVNQLALHTWCDNGSNYKWTYTSACSVLLNRITQRCVHVRGVDFPASRSTFREKVPTCLVSMLPSTCTVYVDYRVMMTPTHKLCATRATSLLENAIVLIGVTWKVSTESLCGAHLG